MAGQGIPLAQLVDRLRGLDEEALAEVNDFVEFLCQKRKTKNNTLLDFVRERALPSITLEQVRGDLAAIHGSLSDVVTELRQERG